MIELRPLFDELNQRFWEGRLEAELRWNSRLRRAGWCVEGRIIELSPHYHRLWPDDLELTLAHEMIHLVHPKEGHGRGFRAQARRIAHAMGVAYERIRYCRPYTPAKYLYQCPACGQLIRTRKMLRNRSCGKCNSKYDPRYKFIFVRRFHPEDRAAIADPHAPSTRQ